MSECQPFNRVHQGGMARLPQNKPEDELMLTAIVMLSVAVVLLISMFLAADRWRRYWKEHCEMGCIEMAELHETIKKNSLRITELKNRLSSSEETRRDAEERVDVLRKWANEAWAKNQELADHVAELSEPSSRINNLKMSLAQALADKALLAEDNRLLVAQYHKLENEYAYWRAFNAKAQRTQRDTNGEACATGSDEYPTYKQEACATGLEHGENQY
jgi:chromosome segregation ATPase